MLPYRFVTHACLSTIGKAAYVSPKMSIHFRNLRTSPAKFNEDRPDPTDSVVTYEQLVSMLASQNVQLVDVRNPDEFQAGRIPGSINIPLAELEQSLRLSPQHFELLFEARAPGKEDGNVVLHCQAGRRSTQALNIARRLGYTRARQFPGGYSEWAKRQS